MADRKGITRFLYLIADRASAKKAATEMEETLRKAGEKGGEAWFRGLKDAYAKARAELREQFAAGKIGADQYKRSLADLGAAYNKNLIANVQKLRTEGKLTDTEYKKLTNTLKNVGTEGSKSLGLISKAVAPLIGFFAARTVLNWGKDLFRAAAEAEDPWNRLGGALENIGMSLANVREELERNAVAFDEGTRWDDEDYADTLRTIVDISGDYSGSLRAVGIAADLAAAKQMELDEAATIVGKAMVGNTIALGKMGIKVKEGDDALTVLEKHFRGRAANDLNTHAGQVAEIGNQWDNFKESLGGALLKVMDAVHAFGLLGNALKYAGNLAKHPFQAVAALATGNFAALSRLNMQGQAAATKPAPPATPQIASLPGVGVSVADARKHAAAQEKAAKDAEERRKAEWQAIDDRISVRSGLAQKPDTRTGTQQTLDTLSGKFGPNEAQLEQLPFTNPEMMGEVATKAAEAFKGPWAGAFEFLTEEILDAGGLVEQLATAWADGGIRGIARFAGVMAKEALVRAIGATARGIAALANPVAAALKGENAAMHFASAAKFGAEAAGWKMLGGAAGGVGGGGVASMGGAGNAGGGTADSAQPRTEIHIYNNFDPFDTHRPAVQDWVWNASKGAVERRGAF
jgi:hypothetical protein